MAVWANHAHVFPADVRTEGSIDRLLRLMDGCGIDKTVAFAPFPHQVASAEIDPNGWLSIEAGAHTDRLIPFGTLDVDHGPLDQQAEQIADLGFPGIKLHPAAQNFNILSEHLFELYGRAEELDLFLAFHTGVHQSRLAHARLIDFDEIAFHFPRLRFSLEHVGGYAFYREAVGVIQNNRRRPHSTGSGTVYAGLTSVFSVQEPAWYLSPRQIEELVEQVGAERIIFGLDFPYKSEAYVREAMSVIRGLDISAEAKEAILGGTLQSLLPRSAPAEHTEVLSS